jgi:tetratricopeptide (TPR) repeat protein
VFAAIVRAQRRILGDEHPDTLTVINNQAVLYRQLDRHAEAEALLVVVVDAQRRVLGDDHPNQLATLSTLGQVYHHQGELEQAEALYVKALDGQRRVNSPAHLATLSTMRVLGALRRQQGDYRQAEALLREALAGFVKVRPDFWARYEIESTLGASLMAQLKFTDAEPHLITGYEGLARLAKTIPPVNRASLPQAGEWILELYRSWGRPSSEAEWRQKVRVAGT